MAPLPLAEGHGNPVKGITVSALARPSRNCFGAAHVGQQTDPNPGKTKHLKISCTHLKTLSGTCSLFTLFASGKICAAHAGHCCVAGGKHASLVKLFWRCPSGRMPTSCPAPAQQTHPKTGTTKHLKISVKHLKTLSGICSGAGAAHACGHHAVKVPCKTVLALPIRANAYPPQPIKLI